MSKRLPVSEFIERRWREGVAEAEYCAARGSLDPSPIANPYDPTSLAGTWWLRGYESMRAILRAASWEREMRRAETALPGDPPSEEPTP